MIRTELIEYNFTFPLSYNELQHTICFSSYNNNDIDLSFQIVYTYLLETNQLSNHMILNLATIYKRSVDYGAVSIHKQPILTDNYYNRYTHLKGIKGNPVLYAFNYGDYGMKYEYITSSVLDTKLSEGKIIKSIKIGSDQTIYVTTNRPSIVYIVRCESVKETTCEYYLDFMEISSSSYDKVFYTTLIPNIDLFVN